MGQRSAVVHDFRESLAASHAASDLPIWEEVYGKAFPTMIGMHDHRKDGQHQRNGIDRSVVLENGKTIWIDEKVRGRNKKTGEAYPDIALEYWSDEARRVPGWVCKPLLCDFICYAIAPRGKAYLLPVQQLQSAWLENRERWTTGFQIRAQNPGYVTVSAPVEVPDLFKCIGKMLRVNFQQCEFEED